jgi:hypothetical protein
VPTLVPSSLHHFSFDNLSPELVKIIAAWPNLPQVIKTCILAMIEATGCQRNDDDPQP